MVDNTEIVLKQLLKIKLLTKFGETNRCPYCKVKLTKVPKRKTTCPNCNQAMYSRTRPVDRKKVLVTKNQLELAFLEWDVYRFIRKLKTANPEYTVAATILNQLFGCFLKEWDPIYTWLSNQGNFQISNQDPDLLFKKGKIKDKRTIHRKGKQNKPLFKNFEKVNMKKLLERDYEPKPEKPIKQKTTVYLDELKNN